jgi:predicted Na+-dependent transporter
VHVQGYGSTALALMLTVVSNLTGIFSTPFLLKAIFSSATGLEPASLLIKLVFTILVPVVIGKALHALIPAVKKIVARHKVPLNLISTGSLILIVWQTISSSAVSDFRQCNCSLCIMKHVRAWHTNMLLVFGMTTQALDLVNADIPASILFFFQRLCWLGIHSVVTVLVLTRSGNIVFGYLLESVSCFKYTGLLRIKREPLTTHNGNLPAACHTHVCCC